MTVYKVFSDSFLLYDDNLSSLQIISPKIEIELNKTGSFEFTVYTDHPYYSMINKLKSIITVYQDDYLLFRGRVLNDELGFYNEKHIACEGHLSFLLDSIQRPFDFSGSISDFLSAMISSHNDQVSSDHQFSIGNVSVTDSSGHISRTSTEYINTLEIMQKMLIDVLGGYLWIRTEGNVNYIDYLDDFSLLSPQKIEFSKNLVDMKRIRKGEEIVTSLIPLGAKLLDAEGQETDERLTVASVNNNVDYIYDQDAVDDYGWITSTVIFEDAIEASDLLSKGQTYLSGLINPSNTIELSAADLAGIYADISSFHIGTYVKVTSTPHGIDQNFLISKLSINLLDSASNRLVLGGKIKTLTDDALDIKNGQNQLVEIAGSIRKETVEAIHILEKNTSSSITQSEESIMNIVNEIFYLKDEEDAIVSAVSTELEQTKDDIEIRFNRFNASLEDIASGTDAEFTEIRKFIRFTDGKIMIGEAGNELELQIANDRISFLQDGAEVAYLSNRKLYVTDGEYTTSLRLGSFAFLPRANGNLSFKKVT